MDEDKAAVERIRAEMEGICDRVTKLEKLGDYVQQIAINVERMVMRQEMQEKLLSNMAEDVETLKSKPAKLWDTIITAALGAVVGAFIAYISRLGG